FQRLRPFVSWKSGRIESGWYNRAQIRDYFNSLLEDLSRSPLPSCHFFCANATIGPPLLGSGILLRSTSCIPAVVHIPVQKKPQQKLRQT
ncbi:hypothetical protein, partial [Solemya velesiana gill symbiont]|uniref:hypothetical protein n=1 Tax=Solemya velesiana gill symbiont TaxID=1918948 RepID=UPI001C12C4AC